MASELIAKIYPPGTPVELHSLSSAALNGVSGRCGRYDGAKGRCAVTLDGGARTVGDRRLAGGGAILWGPRGSAPWARLAEAEALLPGVDHAQEAEAWGARAARGTRSYRNGAGRAGPSK